MHEIHHQSEKRTEPKKEQKGQTKLRLFLGVALASNIYVCLMTIVECSKRKNNGRGHGREIRNGRMK